MASAIMRTGVVLTLYIKLKLCKMVCLRAPWSENKDEKSTY